MGLGLGMGLGSGEASGSGVALGLVPEEPPAFLSLAFERHPQRVETHEERSGQATHYTDEDIRDDLG